jgi:hypothetical protein
MNVRLHYTSDERDTFEQGCYVLISYLLAVEDIVRPQFEEGVVTLSQLLLLLICYAHNSHARACVRVCACVCVCVRTCVHVCMCISVHVCVRKHIRRPYGVRYQLDVPRHKHHCAMC